MVEMGRAGQRGQHHDLVKRWHVVVEDPWFMVKITQEISQHDVDPPPYSSGLGLG